MDSAADALLPPPPAHGQRTRPVACVSDKTIRRDLETFKKAGFRRAATVEEFNRKKRHIKADEQILGGNN